MSVASNKSDTIAHIRARQRVLGKRVHARHVPKQRPPLHVELHYYQLLKHLLNEMHRLSKDIVSSLHQWSSEAATYRHDSAGSDAKKAVSAAAAELLREFNNAKLEGIATKIAEQLSDFQKQQLAGQIRAAFSVDVVKAEPWLTPTIHDFVAENVSLIKSIPSRYFSEIESLTIRNLSFGARPEEIAKQISERFDVAEDRAKFIARDQSNKFFGRLNEARQKDMGVERFVWTTAGDERVREEHEILDGQVFSWDAPPSEGIPGFPANCRCVGEPMLGDIVEAFAD